MNWIIGSLLWHISSKTHQILLLIYYVSSYIAFFEGKKNKKKVWTFIKKVYMVLTWRTTRWEVGEVIFLSYLIQFNIVSMSAPVFCYTNTPVWIPATNQPTAYKVMKSKHSFLTRSGTRSFQSEDWKNYMKPGSSQGIKKSKLKQTVQFRTDRGFPNLACLDVSGNHADIPHFLIPILLSHTHIPNGSPNHCFTTSALESVISYASL